MGNKALESKEELYFSWWLDELIKKGILKSYTHDVKPFVITEGYHIDVIKPMKRVPDKIVKKTIIPKKIYTPDFKLIWNQKELNKYPQLNKLFFIYNIDRNPISIIETKGGFDNLNMTRLFKNNQAFIYEKYKIIITLFKIPLLFKQTFTPSRYLFTDKSKKLRKIKFEVITLKEFLI